MANHVGHIYPEIVHDDPAQIPLWNTAVFYTNECSVWEPPYGVSGPHTNTQPISENVVNHIGHRLPSFTDDFYNRIIIEPGTIDVGNLVSEQFYEINVFNGYFESKELQSLSVQDADGMVISGPNPPSVWGPLETKQYQITIGTDGPPAIDAQVLFDFIGIIDDIVISISGARIVMLPYQASLPWSETLEWKTNVLTANDGSEQRIRLRKKARQSVKGVYPVPPDHLAKAFNMAYGWLQRSWAVALWSETQYVGSVVAGATAIYCDTTKYDFRANGLLCIWQSNNHNEVVEIEAVFADNISLKRVLTSNYTTAFVMPVRIGVITGNILRNTNGYSSNLKLEYIFKDNIELATSAPAQFLGYDIYFDETLMPSEVLEDRFIARMDVTDYSTGVVDYFPPWINNRRGRSVVFINEGPEEAWTFRKWLHRRAGRLRPYWLPTFENNLRINMEGNVASAIQCHADDYRNLGNAHNHIAIQFQDGTWQPRTITGHSLENEDLINIALDSPLNVDATFIRMISFMGLHRLDTDTLDIDWIGNGINTCSARILEIKP